MYSNRNRSIRVLHTTPSLSFVIKLACESSRIPKQDCEQQIRKYGCLPHSDFFKRIWNILYVHPLTILFPENIITVLLEGRKLSAAIQSGPFLHKGICEDGDEANVKL